MQAEQVHDGSSFVSRQEFAFPAFGESPTDWGGPAELSKESRGRFDDSRLEGARLEEHP